MKDRFKSIEIENLTVAYEDTVVFDHFSLTLPSSGCVCFFGPSGSGKTTLLMILAGLKKPLAGRIHVQWDKAENDRVSAEAETMKSKNSENAQEETLPKIAFVFQENRLIPWLTALENVSFVLPKKGNPVETAKKWLSKVGLQDAMDKYPSQLSGGMAQRVNIARALGYDAPVILLDEPFKELDDAIKGSIMEIFQELKKDRLIVLVTHDKDDVRLLADRIIPVSL